MISHWSNKSDCMVSFPVDIMSCQNRATVSANAGHEDPDWVSSPRTLSDVRINIIKYESLRCSANFQDGKCQTRPNTHILCRTHQPQWGSPELKHSPQVLYCSHDSMGTCVTWKNMKGSKSQTITFTFSHIFNQKGQETSKRSVCRVEELCYNLKSNLKYFLVLNFNI